jgi:hypothetical protein
MGAVNLNRFAVMWIRQRHDGVTESLRVVSRLIRSDVRGLTPRDRTNL